jgi:glycine cleavage system regulatory protein
MSGEALFTARARLGVPHSLPIARLQADVERVAGDLMVDIHLSVPADSQ